MSSRRVMPSVWVLVVALVAGGCSAPEPAPTAPILLIGVDGLEWSVLAPMVRDGELPHLRSLMERGTFGKLETLEPTVSPVIWTTIATGRRPEEHGIHGFVRPSKGTEPQRLYSRLDRRVRAFWNVLSDAGQRVHVVGWFVTYPAEPIRGFMVSQFASLEAEREFWKGTLREGVPNQTYPDSFIDELAPEILAAPAEAAGLKSRIFGPEHPGATDGWEAPLIEHTLWALEADTLYGGIAEKILRADPDFDLLAVYFGGTDVVGHRFWRYFRPRGYRHPPTQAQRDEFGEVIPNYYRYVDERIGRLLSELPDLATVLVVSDHGMETVGHELYFERLTDVEAMNSGHHYGPLPGVIIAAGAGIRAGSADRLAGLRAADIEPLGSVLEVVPTLLYLRGLDLARDMEGAVMESILDEKLLSERPARFIDTYERPPEPGEPSEVDPELEEEMIERFRSLGYIGG